MDHSILIESFSEFKEFKSIDRPTMTSILEDVFNHSIEEFSEYRTIEEIRWGFKLREDRFLVKVILRS